VNQIEQRGGTLGLVALKVADQMPPDRIPIGRQRSDLRLGLLHAVFAKVVQAGRKCLRHQLRRVRLTHADQPNLLGRSAGAPGSRRDALPHGREACGDNVHITYLTRSGKHTRYYTPPNRVDIHSQCP